MPDDLDRIEEHRDRVAGLEWEAATEAAGERGEPDPDRREWAHAYELSDPKHPDHHDVFAGYADL